MLQKIKSLTTSGVKHRGVIMAAVMLAMLLSALDQTIVSTALPKIVGELQGLEHLSWVVTAYLLASTVTVPIYGKLSDIYGRKLFYILGIIIFLAGSALCGAAQNMTQLILFRGLQGIGGGAMMVNAIAIIADIFPPAERGRWQGVIGAVFGMATVVGPLLGGWLTDNASWRWVFYVNIPLGLLALIILSFVLPTIKSEMRDKKIDYLGAGLLTAGLVPLLLALVWGGTEYAWDSPTIIGMFIGAAVMLVAFVFAERKAPEPIISLEFFKNRAFAVSVTATFLTALGLFGAVIYIPLFAQGVVGVSATNSGVILLPMMLGLIVASTVSGQIISKTGKYRVLTIIGMAVATFGTWLMSQMGAETGQLELTWNMVVLGVGLGITFPIFNIVVQSAFEHKLVGAVTAATQLFRSLGSVVSVAVLGSIMNSRLAENLAGLKNESFMSKLPSFGFDPTSLNSNTLQGLLSPEGKEAILGSLSVLPSGVQALATQTFSQFFTALKGVLAGAISHTFAIASIFMAAAFIVVWFLPEITLRRSNRPALEEAGVDLELELAQSDPEHEVERSDNKQKNR